MVIGHNYLYLWGDQMEKMINEKREEMHKIMNSKDVKYEEVLKISKELDELIVKYCQIQDEEKNEDVE